MNKSLQVCVLNECYKTEIRWFSSVNISVLKTKQSLINSSKDSKCIQQGSHKSKGSY